MYVRRAGEAFGLRDGRGAGLAAEGAVVEDTGANAVHCYFVQVK